MIGGPAHSAPRTCPDPVQAPIRVCAVVVCFHPDPGTIAENLEAIAAQVDATLVVDNGSADAVVAIYAHLEAAGAISYSGQAANLGLAAGHNVGISWAKQQGFTHVLLMDQDSYASPGMVDRLAGTLAGLEAEGRRVAAVGPRIVIPARRNFIFAFIKLGLLSNQHHVNKRRQGSPVEADIVISSGSLIPLTAIEAIGMMDEALFIDNVDVDWCFRATARGFGLFGDAGTDLQHRLGDRWQRIWFLRWHDVIVHNPVRLYYIMRNRLKLYARPHTPMLWVVQDWYRLGVKLLLFSLFIAPRGRNTRMMIKGLVDGIRGLGGAYPGHDNHSPGRVNEATRKFPVA